MAALGRLLPYTVTTIDRSQCVTHNNTTVTRHTACCMENVVL